MASETPDGPTAISPEILAAGTLVGPYEIEKQIGAGGMGVVFRAHDTRLDRKVAIKVIHPKRSSAQLQAAFVREARVISSLNHPGIVTIYDILRHERMTCIVMEFVQGIALHDAIPEGGFPVDRALSLGLAIGEAVAAAHAAGVVHRDLKPGNILIRDDGRVKILDFGLAKVASAVSADAETEPLSLFGGTAIGTVGYMAPEQARAETVDARADVYSFGVILFRLLTGAMPFRGANSMAVMHAAMTMDPASLRGSNPQIPAWLDSAVLRAMARNPADRYQSMQDLLAELHGQTSPSLHGFAPPVPPVGLAPPAERTIAVLPLVNISPDPENEYLCDGISEELIDGLTRINGLRVVSRSSSFHFKGTTPDVREIGKKLGASYLVHGSLRRAGDHLRLNVQLSKTAEGYQVWSQRFDTKVREVFALQDELTALVLEKLQQQLGVHFPGLDTGVPAAPPGSTAYDIYLQARYAFNRETPAGFKLAKELFERVAAADPDFAPALIGTAETHMRLDWYGLEPASESVPAVKGALAAALRLQPNSVSALCNLAITQAGWDWDWAAAGESFQRALSKGGEQAPVHFHYGLDYLTPLGRLEEALDHLRKASQLDPLSAIVSTAIGGCLYRMRRFDEAADTLQETLRRSPEFAHAHWSLGRVMIEQGSWNEALQHLEEAARTMGHSPAALAEIGYLHARKGERDLAHCAIQELRRRAETEWVSPLTEALVYTGLGEESAAVQGLQAAVDSRIRQLVWVNVDPRYDRLRANPAFHRLIATLGLPAAAADPSNM